MDGNLHLTFGFWPPALSALTGMEADVLIIKELEANAVSHPTG
jgi:hypothetical protein